MMTDEDANFIEWLLDQADLPGPARTKLLAMRSKGWRLDEPQRLWIRALKKELTGSDPPLWSGFESPKNI